MVEVALAGCPSSGKSTFFKACTLKDAKIAPYPFTTLAPSEGTAHVTAKCPCMEPGLLKNASEKKTESGHATRCGKCLDGVRLVPFKLWDIVGLVPDAHLGRGKGVAFLDDIRQASALIHIIDASGRTDLSGNPVEGFDPTESVAMLEREIAWWMADIFKRGVNERKGNEEFVQKFTLRFSGLAIAQHHIEQALAKTGLNPEKYREWKDDEIFSFVSTLRMIAKPALIAANKVDVPAAKENIEKLRKAYPGRIIVPTSGDLELALREAAKASVIKYIPGSSSLEIIKEDAISPKQRAALDFINKFLAENKGTGVQEAINRTVYELLDMIVVYPVADSHRMTDNKGNVLPDAYLIKKGSNARDLAFLIHADIGQKFIAAVDARTGQNISATQPLKDGDIISIKSGR